jgi:hypothetical protein
MVQMERLQQENQYDLAHSTICSVYDDMLNNLNVKKFHISTLAVQIILDYHINLSKS